ncbi:MAG: metal-dependent hydrolase [Haloarculaceae archaeon]
MYPAGHYGMALLAWAPVAAALVGSGHEVAALAGVVGVLVLARVPDYDRHVRGLTHRGVTHTIPFALLVGALLGSVGFLLGAALAGAPPLALGGFGLLVGVISTGSHLLADVLTPIRIAPFWPVTSADCSLGVVEPDSWGGNYGLLALGVAATVAAAFAPGAIR